MIGPANSVNTVFLAVVHVVAFGAAAWSIVHPPVWPTIILAVVWYWCSGISITGGYHRLFSHRSYRCATPVSLFYLLFGAAAVQNSALTWASDHRRHHADTDGDTDPYDARRGLWWSHIGWVFRDDPARDYANVRDLAANRLIAWQHRYYLPVAIGMAGVVPGIIALSWGDPLGGVIGCGCIRLVAQYHATFAINSVAHRFGRQPYANDTSARDNLLVAFVTMGEGYHNFHHRFPSDYRNGVRWFNYDPTKWLVSGLAAVGLTSDLKRVTPEAVSRARRERLHV